MHWTYLFLAGIMEIVWSAGLKWTTEQNRPWLKLLCYLLSVVSIVLLDRAMRGLPLGTCYVIWTGIGAVGALTVGIVLFHEEASPQRLACAALVVIGMAGLKLTAPSPSAPAAAIESGTERS